MTTTYTDTYRINRDGIADLALTEDVETLLDSVRYGDDRDAMHKVESEIDEAITAHIRKHGVTADGEWLGDWSANAVVADILARNGFEPK